MTTATRQDVSFDFFDGVDEPLKFPGTIIISTPKTGERGVYWSIVIKNENTGRFERMSISNADPNNTTAFLKSNKYKLTEAFKKCGIALKGRRPEDFEGRRFDFEVYIKENGAGYNDTVLFLPVGILEPGLTPDQLAALKEEYAARTQGGRAAGASRSSGVAAALGGGSVVPAAAEYSDEDLRLVAELVDGVADDDLLDAAMSATEQHIRQGILDRSALEAALAAGVLNLGADGVYRIP